MSLVPDYGDSSGSSSSSSEADYSDQETHTPTPARLPKPKLPAPHFENSTPNIDDQDAARSSVFKNPFVEAENAKEAILQKHVKMVDNKDKVVVINGKKICWNYRKGRCRFGHNCKFAHDSDLQKSNEQLMNERQIQETVVCQNQKMPQPTVQELEKIRVESIANNQLKRKRPGLTQGLVPGKKVLKKYHNEKL